MRPPLAQLLAALPREEEGQNVADELEGFLATLQRRPVPTGAVRRLLALGGLHAQVAVAYFAWWVRGWFQEADDRRRALAETHVRAALRVLQGMGYLRGAVMKLGQFLANLPDVVPDEVVETLERLHFEAPPMHYSLLREFVLDELGAEPQDLFDSFQTRAFAAASLGQVHRARLKSGEEVAVKIQYPGIGKTIRSDMRNLVSFLAPLRLTEDWDNLLAQVEEVRGMLELETDYEQEAGFLRRARGVFGEDDGIVVPRVHDRASTRRVLTMEYLAGDTIHEFLARDPSPALRDEFGAKIYRANFRLVYSGRLLYTDPHPGNYMFLQDGRLGLLDFGSLRTFSTPELDLDRRLCRAYLSDASGAEKTRLLAEAGALSPSDLEDAERMELLRDFADWTAEPLRPGPFDFGDPGPFRRGAEIMMKIMERRYTRSRPLYIFMNRAIFGTRSMLYRLRARVDTRSILEDELRRAPE
jgi:predicted unusual protein kinase regulating ubiquinone biosynthesis (AarF/ABC1/UbiB family)